MDPVTISLISSAIFGGLGGLFGGDAPIGQERRPFEGPEEAGAMFDRARKAGNAGLDAFAENLGRGVRLRSAYAQTPPVFTGGGLPFPIGVNAQDPALADPYLLELPGIDLTGYLRNWEQASRPPSGGPQQGDTTFPNGSPAPSLRNPSGMPYGPPRPLSEEEQIALALLGAA